MARWYKTKDGGSVARLGHGLELRVLPSGDRHRVLVFGQELVTPAKTKSEAKVRAVSVAHAWLSEARFNLQK